MPEEMDRMEDRLEHLDLRHFVRERVEVRGIDRVLAKGEQANPLDLRDGGEHPKLRKRADSAATFRRPREVERDEEDIHDGAARLIAPHPRRRGCRTGL